MSRRVLALVALALVARLEADPGVLLRVKNNQADAGATLGLRSYSARVEVRGLAARTRIVQVFENPSPSEAEAKYVFRLPLGSKLSDFAIWEDGVRIPGVVIERRRAQRIYEDLTAQKIDPGLVEHEDTGGTDRSAFSCKVYPIPAWGTKRIELEYAGELPVEGRKARYLLPLAPESYGKQTVGAFDLQVRFLPPFPVASLAPESKLYGDLVEKDGARSLAFAAKDLALSEDFAFRFELAPLAAGTSPVAAAAYRDPRHRLRFEPLVGGAKQDPLGYFQLTCLLPDATAAGPRAPHAVLLLADTSLSMRWDKLERMVDALRFMIRHLTPEDRVTLARFDDRGPPRVLVSDLPGGPEGAEDALARLLEGSLEGGTDLSAAVRFAGEWLGKAGEGGRAALAVLVSDGAATRGETRTGELAKGLGGLPEKARLAGLGIGAGADQTALAALAAAGKGCTGRVDEAGDPSFALERFFDKVFQSPLTGVKLALDGAAVRDVYPEAAAEAYGGSVLRFLGRYPAAGAATGAVEYTRDGQAARIPVTLELPEHRLENDHLPRLWAEERVAHLLARIDREGESEELVDEIVRLAKEYKLATPYTSFLAAPRALLRPRAIKPGDPVLRVTARPGIVRVSAVLPWGEVLELRPLPDEAAFEARFLAPAWVEEGSYAVRLLLADGNGVRSTVEEHFVLDGTAPRVRFAGAAPRLRAGEDLELRIFADQDTRILLARLEGGPPIPLRWTPAGGFSTGILRVPALGKGRARLLIEAEDHAHNRSSTPFELEVEG